MRQFNSIVIKQYNQIRGLTLIELLIAICIFSLIVIGFSSIDTFSRYHVITSDRRAKLQNDASYVLGHMAKNIGKAIGNDVITGENPIDLTPISGDTAIRAYVDLANDGQSPGDGKRGTEGDRWIAYQYRGSPDYQMRYYSDYNSGSYEVISRKISNFSTSYSSGNDYVEVQLTACWDPDGNLVACGTLDNPSLSMKNRIYMPAVSTH